jgi:hypothetical protein
MWTRGRKAAGILFILINSHRIDESAIVEGWESATNILLWQVSIAALRIGIIYAF